MTSVLPSRKSTPSPATTRYFQPQPASCNPCAAHSHLYFQNTKPLLNKPPTYDEAVTPNIAQSNAKFILPESNEQNQAAQNAEAKSVSLYFNKCL